MSLAEPSGPMLSPLWYRAADLRPRLLPHARLVRHRYRGQRWYLLQDPASGRVHRFSSAARWVLAAMDGQRSLQQLWQLAKDQLKDQAPSQDELLQLLGQLHSADLLAADTTPDTWELLQRGQQRETAQRRSAWRNPLALRWRLWDPGSFLDRHLGLWRWLWGWPGAFLWLAAVLPALLLLPSHWAELSGNLADRALQASNLWIAALVFPVVKALHELGHATATRARGGEVHDMGLMFLVLLPVPYVDASAASVLPSRWQRALIGAAGMAVELFLAAVAFGIWLMVEPGIVRAVCFNVMLVAGISTVIFNGNPLLRYDAYYMLSDLIEVPNLGPRSSRWWGWLIERHLLRARETPAPETSASLRAWLTVYGLLSAIYRVFVTLAIALFVGTQFFLVGVILALWAVAALVMAPLGKAWRYVQASRELREKRGPILAGAAAVLSLLLMLVVWLPLPGRTQADGVVWLPPQALLRAGAPGFVTQVVHTDGQALRVGDVILLRADSDLSQQVALLTAKVAELEATYGIEFVNDRGRAQVVAEQLQTEQAALARARERAALLPVLAEVDGWLSLQRPQDLPGRWHRKGEVLGHVLQEPPAGSSAAAQTAPTLIRVVVDQSEADVVGSATRGVQVRLADQPERVLAARIVRQVPAGSAESPSPALVAQGGGRVASDPRDNSGRKTLERIFEFDLELTQPLGRRAAFGQRVHVRFELEPAPLATQLWRAVRRLFLRHFEV